MQRIWGESLWNDVTSVNTCDRRASSFEQVKIIYQFKIAHQAALLQSEFDWV